MTQELGFTNHVNKVSNCVFQAAVGQIIAVLVFGFIEKEILFNTIFSHKFNDTFLSSIFHVSFFVIFHVSSKSETFKISSILLYEADA